MQQAKNSLWSKRVWPFWLLVFVVALLALAFGFQFGMDQTYKNTQDNLPNLTTSTIFPKPRDITTFNLTDNKGQPFTNKDLLGHWTFLFFGFTHCAHICPTTMADLNKVYQILKAKNITEPQIWLISIDTKRDTVADINTYVKAFNKNFHGAVGTQAELDKLTKNLNILYLKIYPDTDKDAVEFEIDHSGTIMLINPEGKLAAFFSMPHNADTIAKDFMSIVNVTR